MHLKSGVQSLTFSKCSINRNYRYSAGRVALGRPSVGESSLIYTPYGAWLLQKALLIDSFSFVCVCVCVFAWLRNTFPLDSNLQAFCLYISLPISIYMYKERWVEIYISTYIHILTPLSFWYHSIVFFWLSHCIKVLSHEAPGVQF